ncbi:MAG: DUF5660 domain-containing protein [Candidatus Woesearchaeota archaeon]
MNYKANQSSSKSKSQLTNKNPLETLRDLGSSTVSSTANEFKKIGSGMFDQFFGGSYSGAEVNRQNEMSRESSLKNKKKQEFRVFNYNEYYEKELVKRQIKELSELIKREIEMIKRADSSLLNEVKDIQNLTLESLPDKVGIYHVRFLELVLNILKTIRLKIGESRTWLQALITKKKKRGSLFMARSKKQGTQYSLSQELSNARSVQ